MSNYLDDPRVVEYLRCAQTFIDAYRMQMDFTTDANMKFAAGQSLQFRQWQVMYFHQYMSSLNNPITFLDFCLSESRIGRRCIINSDMHDALNRFLPDDFDKQWLEVQTIQQIADCRYVVADNWYIPFLLVNLL